MRDLRLLSFSILAIATIAGITSPADAGSGNPTRGRALAIEDCSACHQVTAQQSVPPTVRDPDADENIAAPTFATIGRKYAGDSRALRAFIVEPHYPMREQEFLPRDLDDIVAYIQSLHAKD
jgi:mono/diheme cytochrome c family protein